MRLLLIIFTCLVGFSTLSQEDSTANFENKINLFPSSYGKKKWKFLISLDARRSSFADTKIKINGLRLGSEYKGVHRFGFGFYWLNRKVTFNAIIINTTTQDLDDPEVRFDLGYSSIYYERVMLKTRWWEVDLPVQLGSGRIIGTYRDTLGAFQKFTETQFAAFIPSAQVKFYPLTWLTIRGSGGYRFTMSQISEVKSTFRNAFYGYGLSINIIGLYRSVFKKEEKNKNDNPSSDKEIR